MSPLAQLGQDSCKNFGRSTKRKLASSMSTDCIQPSSGSLLKPNLSPPEKWSKANKKGLLWGIQCWSLTFLKHQYQKKGNCRSHEKTLQQILPFLAKENLHLTAGSGASPCRVGKMGKLTVNSLEEPRKGRGCCYTPSLGTLHQHKMQVVDVVMGTSTPVSDKTPWTLLLHLLHNSAQSQILQQRMSGCCTMTLVLSNRD